MKVYAVLEHWDNCVSYEEHANDTTLLDITIDKDTAQKRIIKRRDELISTGDSFGQDGEYSEHKIFDDGTFRIQFQTYGSLDTPFDTYSFGTDEFWWTIEEREVIES